MSAITSSVGLITGIPIQDTVDQLLAISSIPRNNLISRTNEVQAEQAAVDTLASLVLALQASVNTFGSDSTFSGRTASSSSSSVGVSIQSGESPIEGSYQFTPLQAASAHQLVSNSFDDISEAIGDGTLRFGFGGQVDLGLSLDVLNNGDGVAAGEIRISDGNGDSAVIDLRAARTVEDVLLAINSSAELSVTATTQGDSFVLKDNSGGGGALSVTDIGLGTTAADLGLSGQTAVGQTLTGADVYDLHTGTELSALNDGAGVYFSNDLTDVDDLSITLRDGTTFGVDLSGSTNLGDVIDAINNDSDNAGGLTASFDASGTITLTDNTGGSANNLQVANGVLGTAADDLGIAVDVAASSATGSRLVSGLGDTLISQLNGGQGISLGSIDITDRAGGNDQIDLSSAETLGEVIDLINASSVGVTASVNDSRSGIVITDTSGGSGNLTIDEVASGTTAAELGIAIDSEVDSVDGGSLSRQKVSEATLLSTYNGGAGVDLSDIRITDAAGDIVLVDLNSSSLNVETIGDVIDAINNASGSSTVTASINEAGDGILLTDTSGGSGTLTVTEVNGSAAAELGLLGASTTTDGDGNQVIDGSTSYSVDLSDLTQEAESISLSTLNDDNGVDDGIFEVTAADGSSFIVDLGQAGNEAFTIGDVIDKINAAATERGVSVSAAVNSAGTGIELTDTSGGDGVLTVEDLGSGTAAADLNLAGESTTTSGDQTINGSGLFASIDADQGALETLAQRINDLGAGVTASVFSDANGFRLAITADQPGSANQLLIDGSSSGFSFTETSRATDAVALFGSSLSGGGFAVTSTTNEFNGIVEGLDITVEVADGITSTIQVAQDDTPFVDAVEDFVAAYNSIRSNLEATTAFDEDALTTGLLFGRLEALRVDTDLSRVVSGSILSGVEFGSLESIGLSLDDDGRLSIDNDKLRDAFAEDPSGVEELFTDEESGLVTRLSDAIDALAGDDTSLLSSRSDALSRTIDINNDRIARYDEQLELERERLLLEFALLEETIALLQANAGALDSIQDFAFVSSSSDS